METFEFSWDKNPPHKLKFIEILAQFELSFYPFSQFYFHFYYNFRHLKNFSNHKYSAELYVPEKCDKNKFSWELHEIPMAKVCR